MCKLITEQLWISESIGDEYKTWCQGDFIVITSPTGSGKTSFIFNTLLPYAVSTQQKILYLCNRSALVNQLSSYLQERDMSASEYMWIETYQYFEHHSPRDFIEENGIVYCIFDEAHYFFQDASFNANTNNFFEFLYNNEVYKTKALNFVYIFMSATEEYLYALVYYYLISDSNKLNNILYNFDYCKYKIEEQPNCKVYSANVDYRYIKPFYYTNICEIAKKILETSNEEKWLIFVNSWNDATQLTELFGTKIKAASINRKSKYSKFHDGDVYRELIEHSRFSSQVLIATSVIDNGINIDDPDLKHLVVSSNLKNQTLQMIGRKRINKNNPQDLNLYLQAFTKRKLQGHIFDINKRLLFCSQFKEDKKPNENSTSNYILNTRKKNMYKNAKIIRDLLSNTRLRLLLTPNNDTQKEQRPLPEFKISPLSQLKLKWDLEKYQKLYDALVEDEEIGALRQQLSWIGLEYDKTRWLSYPDKLAVRHELDHYLITMIDVPMNKLLQEEFKKTVSQLLIKIYPQKKLGQKKTLGKNLLNKAFLNFNIPYHIDSEPKSRKTIWILKSGVILLPPKSDIQEIPNDISTGDSIQLPIIPKARIVWGTEEENNHDSN